MKFSGRVFGMILVFEGVEKQMRHDPYAQRDAPLIRVEFRTVEGSYFVGFGRLYT